VTGPQITVYIPPTRSVLENRIRQLSHPKFQVILVVDPHPNPNNPGKISCHVMGNPNPEEIKVRIKRIHEILEGAYSLKVCGVADADSFAIPATSQAA